MPIVTTLGFAGRTEEALEMYRDVLDANIVFLMRFRDSPDQSHTQPGMEDLIFHATFRIDGTEFMASDVGYAIDDSSGDDASGDEPAGDEPLCDFAGFALALRLNSLERAQRVFERFAETGHVIVPLAESEFTSWYGIVRDRFGISWKINVDHEAGKPN